MSYMRHLITSTLDVIYKFGIKMITNKILHTKVKTHQHFLWFYILVHVYPTQPDPPNPVWLTKCNIMKHFGGSKDYSIDPKFFIDKCNIMKQILLTQKHLHKVWHLYRQMQHKETNWRLTRLFYRLEFNFCWVSL